MNQKKIVKTAILLLTASILIIAAVLFLHFTSPEPTTIVDTSVIISQRGIADISKISVSNSFGDYEITTDSGGFILHDLPSENVNGDYLKMLLEESSQIIFSTEVDISKNTLEDYGLANPSAIINVAYTDGSSLTLNIGNTEAISKNRYASVAGDDAVYLLNGSKTVRFLAPVEVFINYMIVPFPQTSSPFSAIGDITFSGKALQEPIVIKAVLDEQDLLDASSFGAATHLILSPIFSELDQGYSLPLFTAIAGMINQGIVTYKATDEELFSYGFNEPQLLISFQYFITKDALPIDIKLKIVEQNDYYLVVRDDQRIIHKLAKTYDFSSINPKEMSLRWFLTPLVTDLAEIALEIGEENYDFVLLGNTNKELSGTLNGNNVNIEEFRKYYVMLISAERNGEIFDWETPIANPPLLTLTFKYKNPKKDDDVMLLYEGAERRIVVEVNGSINFTMSENYYNTVLTATTSLQNGEVFDTQWQ